MKTAEHAEPLVFHDRLDQAIRADLHRHPAHPANARPTAWRRKWVGLPTGLNHSTPTSVSRLVFKTPAQSFSLGIPDIPLEIGHRNQYHSAKRPYDCRG